MCLPYSIVFLLSSLGNMLVPSQALMLSCHREQNFVKVSQDGLPSLNALKVTTATKPLFCSTECLDHVGCQSIVFDASKSEDNCMLSSEANGASSNEATVTYVKESSVEKLCDANPCQYGGTCVDTCKDPFYVCNCLPNIKGKSCEENTICETQSCQNGGTCVEHSQSPYYQCQCTAPFIGTHCETNPGCDTAPCQNGGTCTTQTSSPYYSCSCLTYFSGGTCQTNTRCDTTPCQNGGGCTTQNSSPYYTCSCPTYFTGQDCQTNTRCDTNPCQNGATCVPQSSSPYYTCSCTRWFTGSVCQSSTNTDCTQYTLLTDARNVNSRCCETCDDQLVLGWYRIGGAGGTALASYCVPVQKCGAIATGWMNGAHPAYGEGMVTRTVCYHYSGNCCNWSNTIRVLNCVDYYLYELAPSPACSLRYCGVN